MGIGMDMGMGMGMDTAMDMAIPHQAVTMRKAMNQTKKVFFVS